MNIEQVLGLVLELESQSKEIVDKATERRNTLPKRMEQKLVDLRERYIAEAKRRIESIRADENSRLGGELDVIHKAHDTEMAKLSDAVESELDKWAELIFKNVVISEQS